MKEHLVTYLLILNKNNLDLAPVLHLFFGRCSQAKRSNLVRFLVLIAIVTKDRNSEPFLIGS